MRGPLGRRWRPTRFVVASLALHGVAAAGLLAAPAWWPWLLLAVAVNHAAILGCVMWPHSHALGPILVRLPAEAAARGEVAITFDDGPDPAVTPHVLAMLAAAGATASFFCIGARASRHPELIRGIVQAGHSVENHTMRHPCGFAALTPAAIRREVMGAQAALTALAGQPPCFFRAPMGFRSPLLDPVTAHAGLQVTAWTRRGFDTLPRRSASVVRAMLHGLAAGDVLVLHDGNAGHASDGTPLVLAVLPTVLAALRAQGLRAVSLPAACGAAAAASAAANPAPGGYASMSAAHCRANTGNA